MKEQAEMTKSDKILLNFACSPISFKNKTALQVLHKLEKKYPNCRSIQRKTVDFYIQSEMPIEAIFKLVFMVRKHLDAKDICQLIFHSFKAGILDFVFFQIGEIKILEGHENYKFYKKALEILKNKSTEIDFDKMIASSPFENVFSKKDVDYSYTFNFNYSKLIKLSQLGKFKDFLDLSICLFQCKNYHGAIEYFVESQKLEILRSLSNRNPFFLKYYLAAQKSASGELIEIIEVILAISNPDALFEICELLKSNPCSNVMYDKACIHEI